MNLAYCIANSLGSYTPEGIEGKKLPLGVYYHGGGWVLGNLDGEDAWCRYIAKNTPCILVSVDYRLAPKFKHPAMLDDSITAFNWVSCYAGDLEQQDLINHGFCTIS
jgi:versiconal hemiacetal acetate esterase